jgi:hypothetical protein
VRRVSVVLNQSNVARSDNAIPIRVDVRYDSDKCKRRRSRTRASCVDGRAIGHGYGSHRSEQAERSSGRHRSDGLELIAGDGLWFLSGLLEVIANRVLAILGAA